MLIESLMTLLFNKMHTGIISRSTNNILRAQSLKTISFAVYSGAVDEYQCCTQMICEKLIEFIKIDDENLKSCVYHRTVVLLLRLSSESLKNLWARLWPHLFTDIWQILTEPTMKDQIKKKENKEREFSVGAVRYFNNAHEPGFSDIQTCFFFFYDNIRVYQESIKEDSTDSSNFKPLLELINDCKKLVQDAGDDTDEIYKPVVRNLMIDDAIQEDHIGYKIKKVLRESMRKSESIFVPSLDTVEKMIENKFLV